MQRVLAHILVVVSLALVACSDDEEPQPRPRAAATTTSTAAAVACDEPPRASDGTAAEVVGETGGVQLAVVDHGASVEVISLFRGCPPEPVRLDGAPAAFPVGGTVTHGDGMACVEGRFEVRSATSDDGATYQAVTRVYRLVGDDLVLVDEEASTIEAQRDPDTLQAFYELDC